MADQYIELERELAVELGASFPEMRSNRMQWCRDNGTAFSLIGEYDLKVTSCGDWVSVDLGKAANMPLSYVVVAEHPDKDTAIRVALVKAVIKLLREQLNDVPQ